MQGSGGAAEVYDNDDAVLYPEGAGIWQKLSSEESPWSELPENEEILSFSLSCRSIAEGSQSSVTSEAHIPAHIPATLYAP
jgi:hypothetical protein